LEFIVILLQKNIMAVQLGCWYEFAWAWTSVP